MKEKEPWQMMRAEYVDGHYRSAAMHKYAVQKAISEGKPVPGAIQAEYKEERRKNLQTGLEVVGLL